MKNLPQELSAIITTVELADAIAGSFRAQDAANQSIKDGSTNHPKKAHQAPIEELRLAQMQQRGHDCI